MTCTTCQHLQGELCAKGHSRDDVPWQCADYTPDCGGCNVLEAYRREAQELRERLETALDNGINALADRNEHAREKRARVKDMSECIHGLTSRAQSAEAEVRRLRDGIAGLAAYDVSPLADYRAARDIILGLAALLEPKP